MLTSCWEECSATNCDTVGNFWQCIDVWILKPHVLCKKIGAVEVFDVGYYDTERITCFRDYFVDNLSTSSDVPFKENITSLIHNFKELKTNISCHQEYHVSLRLLYPKSGSFNTGNFDIIIKDKPTNQVTFIKPFGVSSIIYPIITSYSILCQDNKLKILVSPGTKENEQLHFLRTTLLPKLVRWMEPDYSDRTPQYSHKLIPAHEYVVVYNEIKEKYYKSIQAIWTESTNPQKFIIEDIAIATYLLVLWGGKPQRYVDLGCGNGLLVHILNSENHSGIGFDVRARKIWKSYPKTTVLKETAIMPSLDCQFLDVDWIIGNHSDELTPWIPVIAAKSDYKTNFFLLPCCHFEFDGSKYARSRSNLSCYEEYMKYIESVCDMCGFNFERDRLKIPSTKRNCFVSRGRSYSIHQKSSYDFTIDNFVNRKINCKNQIKIRESKEKVKNCTQLDKNFLNSVVTKVANHIISSGKGSEGWNEGEFTDLKDIMNLIPLEGRLQMKSECGGLQTLLKNHHHIFLVLNGKVKLRKPTERTVPQDHFKKKDCWFYTNHPDSCPLSDSQCSFVHNNQVSV